MAKQVSAWLDIVCTINFADGSKAGDPYKPGETPPEPPKLPLSMLVDLFVVWKTHKRENLTVIAVDADIGGEQSVYSGIRKSFPCATVPAVKALIDNITDDFTPTGPQFFSLLNIIRSFRWCRTWRTATPSFLPNDCLAALIFYTTSKSSGGTLAGGKLPWRRGRRPLPIEKVHYSYHALREHIDVEVKREAGEKTANFVKYALDQVMPIIVRAKLGLL
ncbi:hypothetical protein JCM8547_000564 [Rhodosporidiobolus lusitaniae]